jgi:hypothetical protein
MATRKKTKRETKRVWLSYDLGLRGDYSALYEWLDTKGAKECGDSIATFQSDRTRDELSEELSGLLSETPRARIYLISKDGGKFLFGKRKAAPWAGYSEAAVENVLDR